MKSPAVIVDGGTLSGGAVAVNSSTGITSLAINAGTIADGTASIEDVGWELFHLMLDVASGRKKTWAEQWKLHNALVLFNPAPVT